MQTGQRLERLECNGTRKGLRSLGLLLNFAGHVQ